MTPLKEDRFLEYRLKSREKFISLHTDEYIKSRYASMSFPSWVKEQFHVSSKQNRIEVSPSKELVVLDLEEAFKTFGSFISSSFLQNLKKEEDLFSLLNGAYFEKGYWLYLPPNKHITTPISLKHILEGTSLSMSSFHIFLGKNSSMTLLFEEECEENLVHLSSFSIHLEEEASLRFLKKGRGISFASSKATLKKNAKFQKVLLSSSSFSRNEESVSLYEGSDAHLYGLSDLKGREESHVSVKMEHVEPFAHSNQLFKHVLEDVSKASFEGKIYVHPIALKTEAYQLSHTLLLSEGARSITRPNLEIFADDVKASHGATVGQLSEDELFYLQSRGINRSLGTKLLVEGFKSDILQVIPT